MNLKYMISKFFADSRRIFTVSRKPTWDEFKKMSIIIALGIAIIGIMGYIIYLIFIVTQLGV